MKSAFVWLSLGFIGNGIAQFLQKYLHASGFGGFQSSVLILMYAMGSLLGLALLVSFGGRPTRLEILYGLGVGLCSYTGNFAVLRALGYLPAYTVFPIVVGGPMITVALVSPILLRESLSRTAIGGILCGALAVVLLSF